VDKTLLGGLVVQINDVVADFSIAKELKQIRERIISHRVRSEEIYEN
jgi:F0F1-type ATP synthase delta subunit